MSNLKQRLTQLEKRAGSGRRTWALETWKQETAAGVPLDDQERRRLAEHPERAKEIRQWFAIARRQTAQVKTLLDPAAILGGAG